MEAHVQDQTVRLLLRDIVWINWCNKYVDSMSGR